MATVQSFRTAQWRKAKGSNGAGQQARADFREDLPGERNRRRLVVDQLLYERGLRQLVAEPGGLALGVAAGCRARLFARLLKRELAPKMGAEFGHADGLHSGKSRIEGLQASRLLERALRQH